MSVNNTRGTNLGNTLLDWFSNRCQNARKESFEWKLIKLVTVLPGKGFFEEKRELLIKTRNDSERNV